MTVNTALALRWQRAQQIDRASIQPLGHGWFSVPSSQRPTGYTVEVQFGIGGRLAAASCTCADYERITSAAPPTLHGLRVCKHILAACLKAKET
jgi:hypothetical protein